MRNSENTVSTSLVNVVGQRCRGHGRQWSSGTPLCLRAFTTTTSIRRWGNSESSVRKIIEEGKKKKLANRSKWKQYENRYGGIKRDWLPNMARNGFLEQRRSFTCVCVCVYANVRLSWQRTCHRVRDRPGRWREKTELRHEFLLQGWMMPFGLQQALKFLFYTLYFSICTIKTTEFFHNTFSTIHRMIFVS